jgi:hypothetical protein
MLASTVQFSRYGRQSNVTLRVHQEVPFEALGAEPSLAVTAKKVGYKPAPSGLNSVPTPSDERKTTFHPTREPEY